MEFQRVFCEQFYPNSFHDLMKAEFLGLCQGDMSLLEYEHKFIELLRFAPEAVATEAEKCSRFAGGLRPDIQAVVATTVYPTMRALAQAAYRVAQRISAGTGTGRRGRDTTDFGGPSQGPSKKSESSSGSAGSRWSSSSVCCQCGQVGHVKRDCPVRGQTGGAGLGTGGKCYNCGQAGHLGSVCPFG